jgi:hypothetical protein
MKQPPTSANEIAPRIGRRDESGGAQATSGRHGVQASAAAANPSAFQFHGSNRSSSLALMVTVV